MKWVTVVIAPEETTATMWRDLLLQEELPAMIRSSDAVSFLGISIFPCRLVVPEHRKEEALAILELHLGNGL